MGAIGSQILKISFPWQLTRTRSPSIQVGFNQIYTHEQNGQWTKFILQSELFFIIFILILRHLQHPVKRATPRIKLNKSLQSKYLKLYVYVFVLRFYNFHKNKFLKYQKWLIGLGYFMIVLFFFFKYNKRVLLSSGSEKTFSTLLGYLNIAKRRTPKIINFYCC